MSNPIIVMDFSQIYQKEDFYKKHHYEWVNCTDIEETNCYCSEEGKQKIEERMKAYSPNAIHFIDSGNYHYVSKLWMNKIKESFVLVVVDHHPDTQRGLLEELSSCGGWVQEVLKENPYVKKVLLLGVKQELIEQIEPIEKSFEDKIKVYTEEQLKQQEGWLQLAKEPIEAPIYISIDKDVLDIQEASTNWDQGTLTLENVKEMITLLQDKQKLLGVDIAGEAACTLAPEDIEKYEHDCYVNNKANEVLLKYLGTVLTG